jgi:hypothetical protein
MYYIVQYNVLVHYKKIIFLYKKMKPLCTQYYYHDKEKRHNL